MRERREVEKRRGRGGQTEQSEDTRAEVAIIKLLIK